MKFASIGPVTAKRSPSTVLPATSSQDFTIPALVKATLRKTG
ncbi:MAG: hypothetical protein ACLRWP_03920 [Bilophila wadsworthia]